MQENQNVHPSKYFPELTDDMLNLISGIMLDQHSSAVELLNSEYDSNYGIGCVAFDRIRQNILVVVKSGDYPQLKLESGANDYGFYIGRVLCRVFVDDVRAPKKRGFFQHPKGVNEDLFGYEDGMPQYFRFVLQKALNDESEDKVFFQSYWHNQSLAFEWECGQEKQSSLHIVGENIPASKPLSSAPFEDRDSIQDEEERNKKSM